MAITASGSAPIGLAALEARLREDLAWLDLPARPWVVPAQHAGQPMRDVVIIGAGMAGLAVAAALKLQGVSALAFDRSPPGFEGPWATSARMETLRSPKQLTGPALGLPALTFRAWFEAQFGHAAWGALDKIERMQWMDYLRWYRQVLGLDVRNRHTVERVVPHDDRVELSIRDDNASAQGAAQVFTVQARRVVLATGRDGLGRAWMPDFAAAIAPQRKAHSSEEIDYARLRGLRVAVIGGSASAMDCAATALEAGAASVDLLIRRAQMPLVNRGKGAGSPGMTHGYPDLSDDWKWRIRLYLAREQTPPPRGSTLRVSRHANARFNMGCPILAVEDTGERVRLRTPAGIFEADFVVFATGFRVDFAARPEFSAFAPFLRRWGDRFEPPVGDEDEELASLPDVGPAFEFREIRPGVCPGLARLHCFCYPAVLSHGAVSGDIPAISDGALRLVQGLTSRLFQEGIDGHLEAMKRYADAELLGDEWRPAAPPPLPNIPFAWETPAS